MIRHSPLLTELFRHAAETPGKVAIRDGEEAVTYAQLAENVVRAANALRALGVRRGDRMALSAQKGLGYVYCYLGSQLLGSQNVVVDADTNPDRLRFIEGKTTPVLCLGYVSPNVRSLSFADLDLAGADSEMPFADSEASPEDTAEIMFTTGTTGVPKGVCLSHRNIYSSASNINSFIGNGADDVEVLALPICHSFGLGRLRCNLLTGATIVLLGSFANLPLFFNALEHYGATGFGMVPAVWAFIRKISGTRISRYAPQIRYIEIGSAAMPIEQKEELCHLFPTTRICHHYGLTEASRAVFMEYHAEIADLKTIGREVCDRVSVRICDEQGHEASVGTPGEICVKGNMVMRGYLGRETSDGDFFDGYFRTGDVGYRSPGGKLYLVSRKKEIINVGGKKVSPVEIEDAAMSLGVEDCICGSIPDPQGILGEVPKLYVLKDGMKMSFDELKAALSEKLEAYKIPAEIVWIDVIPKTSSGKKQRLQLKA